MRHFKKMARQDEANKRIRNGEVETIGEKKVKSAQNRKRGSKECRTQLLVGSGSQRVGGSDGCHVMKGGESQKRKRSSRMQNVNKTRGESGWRGETETFMSSDKLSQTSALTFTQVGERLSELYLTVLITV